MKFLIINFKITPFGAKALWVSTFLAPFAKKNKENFFFRRGLHFYVLVNIIIK